MRRTIDVNRPPVEKKEPPRRWPVVKKDNYFTFFIIIVIVIVLVAVGIGLRNINDDNGGDNDDDTGKRWDDLQKFKEFLYDNYTVLEKSNSDTAVLNQVTDKSDSVWIIIGVDKEFTSEEASAVRNFVNEGGNLILAAETTHANKISKTSGVEFLNHRVIETENYDLNEVFIPFQAYLAGTTYNILLNAPMGLSYDDNITSVDFEIIAESSGFTMTEGYSFLDMNDNGGSDMEDLPGPIPTIIEVDNFGEGKIIFLSDSGLFTDNLWGLGSYENEFFCKDLMKYTVSRQGSVVYDFSKHDGYLSGHKQYPR
ncbi:MAG: hypothetical protein JSV49_11195 [Thermoplasmata archaeon]|nr:MAG: hypothetical protein JSV49_11195 [Thermoplasmata archaeon]